MEQYRSLFERNERLTKVIEGLNKLAGELADEMAGKHSNTHWPFLEKAASELLAIKDSVDDVYALTYWSVLDNEPVVTGSTLSDKAFAEMLYNAEERISERMIEAGWDVIRDECGDLADDDDQASEEEDTE